MGPQEEGGFLKSKPPKRLLTWFIIAIVGIHAFLAYGFMQRVPPDPRLGDPMTLIDTAAPSCDRRQSYASLLEPAQVDGQMSHPPYLRSAIVPPALVAERGLYGQMVVGVAVGADGRVQSACLRASSGHQPLDTIVWADALTWQFAPARQDGRAVPGRVFVPIAFPAPPASAG
jgi:protein TonB